MFEIVRCLEVEIDVAACCGLEHLIGGIVEVVVVEAVRGGGKWGRERKCQGALTVGKRSAAAYMSEVRALFSFRPPEMCFAPSSPMLLLCRLRARVERKQKTNVRGR